ncbi:hypothetical protein G9A89_003252 [Geosiphon pyriformis]|nr:hypothetical protein G9A89_003252 [Geosiphon pyriformis]
MNCFLAGTTCALNLCNLSLGGNLPNGFQTKNNIAVLNVLSSKSYLSVIRSLKKEPVSVWFVSLVKFINESGLLNSILLFFCSILADSPCDFGYISKYLLDSGLNFIIIYMNGSIKNLGLLGACGDTTAYFPDVNISIGVKVNGLLSSTLVELQTIALVLECVPASLLQININNIKEKRPKTSGNIGVVRNKHANFYANTVIFSKSFLPLMVSYCFLNVESRPVFGSACYVAKKLFYAVYSVGWKARCVGSTINANLCNCFNVWHPNMAKRKKTYNSRYLSATYIWCGMMKDSNYIFSCAYDGKVKKTLLSDATLE